MKEENMRAIPQDERTNAVSVTRRRFLGCAGLAGASALGATALGTVGMTAFFRSGESDGYPNQEALKELLNKSQQGASGKRLPVMDLHTHPSMKAYMLGQRFWKRHEIKGDSSFIDLSVDIDSLVNGGVGVFFSTAYVLERQMFSDVIPIRALSMLHPRAHHMATAPLDVLAHEYLDTAEEMVAEARRRRGDVIEVAKSFPEMERIVGEGKLCMVHAFEGAHHLSGKLENVDTFFKRGVCMITVPHLYPNETGGCIDINKHQKIHWWAKGSFSPKYQEHSGLSAWGHQLVEKLFDVGIVVDVTHGTREYRKQVLDIARNHPKKRPIAMSHVDVSGPEDEMCPLPEEIRAIADTGGVVGVMMVKHSIVAEQDPIQSILHAVAHLVRNGGEDVVAIGSDFDGCLNPKGVASSRDFGPLRSALLAKYTEEQTAKFLFGNGERLLRLGWGNV